MNRFERIPATIAQTADHYYELRADGIVTIGGESKSRLVAWARTHGFAPSFVDERKATPRTYLSKSGLDWRLIHQGMPLCADGPIESAIATAKRFNLTLPSVAWDGLSGCFFPFNV